MIQRLLFATTCFIVFRTTAVLAVTEQTQLVLLEQQHSDRLDFDKPFTQIASGVSHTAALKDDSTVVVWGNNDFGQTTVPAGLSGVQAIAVGDGHTVALKSDGTVVAWGDNICNQTTVPTGLSGVESIAAGSLHTVALTNKGLVVAWGYNYDGQVNVPMGLSDVQAVAAGGSSTVALKADGTVVGWGRNNNGQTNVPAGLIGVKAIAAGYSHTVALKNDGTVVAWGHNGYGQTTVPVDLSNVKAIAAGKVHTVALKNDGTIVAWGVPGQTEIAELRTWVHKDGRSIKAKLLEVTPDESSVLIRRDDGQTFQIKISELAAEDITYIKEHIRPVENPESNGPSLAKSAKFSIPSIVELSYPTSFSSVQNPDRIKRLDEVKAILAQGGVRPMVDINSLLDLIVLKHNDPEYAHISLMAGPPEATQADINNASEEDLKALTDALAEQILLGYKGMGVDVPTGFSGRRIKCPDGLTAFLLEHVYKMPSGKVRSSQKYYIYTDRFVLVVGVMASPEINSNTKTDIDSVIRSIRVSQ